MAVIDVDRHIFTEVVAHNRKIKEKLLSVHKSWLSIIEVRDKVNVLLRSKNKDEAILGILALRRKMTKATSEIDSDLQSLVSHSSKQEALLGHVISAIQDFHTGKGSESIIIDDSKAGGGDIGSDRER